MNDGPLGTKTRDDGARTPFLARYPRAVTAASFALLAVLFGFHIAAWHFPHRAWGAFAEWPLLAGALVAGAVGGFAWHRWARRDTALPVAAIASVAAFVVLRPMDPFAGERDWAYAPPDCEFAVSFARRPQIVRGQAGDGAAAELRALERALLVELGTGSAMSAECVAIEVPAAAAAAGPALRARTEALLRASAERLRVKIRDVAQREDNVVVLRGETDEGRTADNEPLMRKAAAYAMIGNRSLMVMWGWRITRDPAAGMDIAVTKFFGSVRRGASARP